MKFWLVFGLMIILAAVMAWGVVRAANGDFWLLGFATAGLIGLFYHGGQAH